MYEWSLGIFAKKTKFHDAGGPGTVVSPKVNHGWVGRSLLNKLPIKHTVLVV